jgi:hypothetical protein
MQKGLKELQSMKVGTLPVVLGWTPLSGKGCDENILLGDLLRFRDL